jgi:hypothetical protein
MISCALPSCAKPPCSNRLSGYGFFSGDRNHLRRHRVRQEKDIVDIFPTQFALIQVGTNTRDPEFLALRGKDCADTMHRIRSQPLLRKICSEKKSCAKEGIIPL